MPDGLTSLLKLLRRVALALAIVSAMAGADRALAETRVALVIGNGKYRAVPALTNPPFDAQDISDDLRSLGFKVTVGLDLDLAGMDRAIADFAKAAAQADVSLIYYSGHGVQLAGHNYLIPIDAELRDEQDIYQRTIHFDEVMKALQQAKGIHLLLLDACRTSPVKNPTAAEYAGPGAVWRFGQFSDRLCDSARQCRL